MKDELDPSKHQQNFESIKHMGEDGNGSVVRELQPVLEYSKWERFQNVLNRP